MYIDVSKKDVSEIPEEIILKELVFSYCLVLGLDYVQAGAYYYINKLDKNELFAIVKFLIQAYQAKEERERKERERNGYY